MATITIPEALKGGVNMVKVSEKRTKPVVFKIDPDNGCITWESKKHGKVPIECIKELRFASQASFDRDRLGICSDDALKHGFKLPESRWTTIVYVISTSSKYQTLNVVASSDEQFTLWRDTLKKLLEVRKGLMSGLGNESVREEVWERMYWKTADADGDNKVGLKEIEALCTRLGMRAAEAGIVRLFQQADKDADGNLDREQFRAFVKLLKRRPDIHTIFNALSGEKDTLDYPGFLSFMKDTQQTSFSEDRIRSLFAKYATGEPTSPSAPTQISASAAAPPDSSASSAPDSPASAMTPDQFSSFLLSADNSPFRPQEQEIWQDMKRPMSEYYLSSSHNTYLVGHQLVGVSTVEGYVRALLHSCRTVELDIYDGNDGEEPVVYHGKTLTSKVPVRDICKAIRKYAFTASPYPVIVSAEVHCGIPQQEKMVIIMREEFGDALVQAPPDRRPKIEELPSPEDMKGKIMLKAKNIMVIAEQDAQDRAAQEAAKDKARIIAQQADSDTSSTSSSDASTASKASGKVKGFLRKAKGHIRTGSKGKSISKPKMSFSLASLLVYTVGVKCRGFQHADGSSPYKPEHIFSLSESKANGMLKEQQRMNALIKHNQSNVTRIYPKGLRVSSSNYEPNRYWAAGAQVVALNWQTFDIGYMINMAMFARNGRSGYILKPDALRDPTLKAMSDRTKHFLNVKIISAQQLPCPRDKYGLEMVTSSIVDPVVEVTLHIPDWTHSPFLPSSASTSSTPTSSSKPAYSGAGAPQGTATAPTTARTVTLRTSPVKNNGFNPIWEKELSLPFDVVGGKEMMDLIFVRFVVWQDGKGDDDDDVPIGSYCTSLGSLEQGFRHLPLHDQQMSQFLFSTLFVKIDVKAV